MNIIKKTGTIAVATAALASSAAMLPAPAADASQIPGTVRQCVSAETLRVKASPNTSEYFAVLKAGEAIDVQSTNGPFAYGYAYGGINQYGYVDSAYLYNC